MTENEIKEYIAVLRNKADILRKSGFATNGVSNHFDKSADVIEELLSYRAIGTVEKFKVLKEKNDPKKIDSFSGYIHNNIEQDWDFMK